MLTATQIRSGMIVLLDAKLYRIMNVTHLTPGNKRGIIQTQLRNLTSGNQEERRFSTDEKVERATLMQHELEYLYCDGTQYHFMNTENYEAIELEASDLGAVIDFLLPNMKVIGEFHDERPVGVTLPQTVVLTVAESEPTVKRATASASFKQAKLETGFAIKVPNFIQAGEKIRVDTTTGEYVERA